MYQKTIINFQPKEIWKVKKKISLLIALALITLITWVIDPFTLNPFAKTEIAKATSTINYTCESPNNQTLKEQADSAINKTIENKEFLGVSVGLYKQNCGSYIAGAGFSHKQANAKADGDMLNRIASITKPMTAVAIMQLYEQGLIDLDAPIQTYLPDFPKKPQGDISVRQLLQHTSGFPHYSSQWDALSFTHYNTLRDAVNSFKARELSFTPGTKFQYTSFGYTILGAIIESVSKTTYEDYMQKNIWAKAGMTHTHLERNFNDPHKAGLYAKVQSVFIRSPQTDGSVIYPAGGVESTAEDLLKFGEAILNNQLIRSDTLASMIDATHSLAPAAGDDPYGLG